LIIATDKDLDGKINLSEYITLRRGIIAWSECADSTMSPKGLKCGLGIINAGKSISQLDANNVFEFGVSLQKKNKYRISFPIFIMIADLYRIFSGFDVHIADGYITKKDIKKKILEQDLPIRLPLTTANAILDLDYDKFDFNTFSTIIILFNRYYLYSNGFNINNNFMTIQQFMVFMHDKMIPK